MKLLMILLGTIIGIVVFLSLIILFVYIKVRRSAKKLGFSNFNGLMDEIKKGENDYKYNHKPVSGMTRLLKPTIEKDFPSFNESELFNMTETNLLMIFNTIEDKEFKGNLPLLNDKLKEIIKDYKTNNINVKYDDVYFHGFAIKDYYKKSGVATIKVSTSLEYYYTKEKDNKIIENYSDYKKQTSFTVDFIYVYDVTQIKDYTNVIGINCPNCGAPVKDLGNKVCRYCNTGLEDLNLKNWHISSYKEDY